MNDWKQRLIHLDHCRGVGWQTIFTILKSDPTLELIYQRPIQYWQQVLHSPSKSLETFLNDLNNSSLRTATQTYSNQNIHMITFLDSEYPIRLKEIHQPPWILYCKGDCSLLKIDNILAVIGTRLPSSYGISVIKGMIPELISHNICIVSGLAKGIDSIAQRQAVSSNGKVIAVIGGGLNYLYPQENVDLAIEIMEKGLVLSEYPPIVKPEKWHFPMRNRIISALSRGILVVEGKKRSGTFITVLQGLEQGKDVFAIPGSIQALTSEGPNLLIKEGAKMVTTINDIIEEW